MTDERKSGWQTFTEEIEVSGQQLLNEINRLIDAGEVRPSIDRVFPLNASADAERRLENEHVHGKVVVTLY